MIEGQREQGLRHLLPAEGDGNQVWRKCVGDQPRDDARGSRCHLRRLQDSAVAGSKAGDKRPQAEIEWVIPGRDDKAHAAWLRHDPSGRAETDQCRSDMDWPHPSAQITTAVADFLHDRKNFRQKHFGLRLAEVGRHGLDDLPFELSYGSREARQRSASFSKAKAHPALVRHCLLRGEEHFHRASITGFLRNRMALFNHFILVENMTFARVLRAQKQ